MFLADLSHAPTFQLSERNLDLVSSKALAGKNGVVSNGVGGAKLDPLNHHPAIQPKAFLSSTSPAASDARRAHSILNNNVIPSSTCTTNDGTNGGNANGNLNSQSQLLAKPTIRATLSSAADNRNNNVRYNFIRSLVAPSIDLMGCDIT